MLKQYILKSLMIVAITMVVFGCITKSFNYESKKNQISVDKLVVLATQPNKQLEAIPKLAEKRYNIDKMMQLSHSLSISSKIILLSIFFKKSNWIKLLTHQDIVYYKKLVQKYNQLIISEIKKVPELYYSEPPIIKLRLVHIWIANKLYLDYALKILHSIQISKLEVSDEKVNYFLEYAQLYNLLNQHKLSEKYLKQALMFKKPNIFFIEANVAATERNWSLASVLMRKYMELEYGKCWYNSNLSIEIIKNKDFEDDFMLTFTYWSDANTNKARLEYALRSIVFSVNSPRAKNMLAYIWAEDNKNLSQALKFITEALQNSPNNIAFIDTYGYVLYQQQKYNQAIKQLEKADKLQSDNATIKNHLGDAYFKVEKVKQAYKQWNKALELTKDEDLKKIIKKKLRSNIGKQRVPDDAENHISE